MSTSHQTGAPRKLQESYPAVASSVPVARQELAKFAEDAGAPREQVEALRLAASEALTNAVVHAYHEPSGQVHVDAAAGPDTLSVQVADDGNGLSPRLDRPGLGLGLALIARASDEIAIVKRSSGGTVLRMRFAL